MKANWEYEVGAPVLRGSTAEDGPASGHGASKSCEGAGPARSAEHPLGYLVLGIWSFSEAWKLDAWCFDSALRVPNSALDPPRHPTLDTRHPGGVPAKCADCGVRLASRFRFPLSRFPAFGVWSVVFPSVPTPNRSPVFFRLWTLDLGLRTVERTADLLNRHFRIPFATRLI